MLQDRAGKDVAFLAEQVQKFTAAAREIYNHVKGNAKEDLDYSAVMKFWQR